jgi:deazaflavin-dependent oxidoreductase (nitroreductase family)
MSVDVTPKGTRGARIPQFPGWLTRAVLGMLIGAYRLSGGRMTMFGVPMLVLTTVGAKSGKTRRVPLTWFPDRPGSRLIVASLGGAANHPAWFYNLARNPDKVWIEIKGSTTKVRPETLQDTERAEAWKRIVATYKGYGDYERKTDRLIPVVRLVNEARSTATS